MVAPTADPAYVPERGDVVWLQSGHEQAGHRPVVVVSPKAYNGRVRLALFCPISTNVKGYPFEVRLPEYGKTVGAILSDQIRSLDWRARRVRKFDQVPIEVMDAILMKIGALVGRD